MLSALHWTLSAPGFAATKTLVSGAPDDADRLLFGETLVSDSGNCILAIKEDAELIIYYLGPDNSTAVVWRSDKRRAGLVASDTFVVMETDGNLVVYNLGVYPWVWDAQKHPGTDLGPYTARMSDDGCQLRVTFLTFHNPNAPAGMLETNWMTPAASPPSPPLPPPSPLPPRLPPEPPPRPPRPSNTAICNITWDGSVVPPLTILCSGPQVTVEAYGPALNPGQYEMEGGLVPYSTVCLETVRC